MKIARLIILLSVMFFALGNVSYSEDNSNGELEFGFHLGLSTPNDQINDIYNGDNLPYQIDDSTKGLGNLLKEGARVGYHLGIKVRLPLDDKFIFKGGLLLHRFPESEIEVTEPASDTVIATLASVQNIVAISAGMNYYFLKSFIGVYGVGDLSFNYMTSSVDKKMEKYSIPISTSPTDSRVGFGLGAGIDLDVKLLKLNLEGKFNIVNLIGKESGEEPKSFFALGLGVYF